MDKNAIAKCFIENNGAFYNNLDDYFEIFEVDGVWYDIKYLECGETTDDGKYQYGSYIYEIINMDTRDGIELFVKQAYRKTGSYYSEFYYEYETPVIVEKATKLVEYWKEV